jgi:CheY-like chemotaxis protein
MFPMDNTVSIPAERASTPDRDGPTVAGGHTPTILVVEDDDLHFEVLEALLVRTGGRIVRETSLRGATQRLEQETVALIVSDLLVRDGLPDASLRVLVELPAVAPIIVVTSWSGQLASHILTGGSRLKLFDKNNFDYGLFLATVNYLLSRPDAETSANPFGR